MFGPRLRTNVHPTSGRRRPGSRRGCLSSVIGELLETSNSSEEARLLCTFKTESTDTANEPLYLREQHENSDEKVYQKKIQELQETPQRKIVYGEVLEEEMKCLKNDLN